MTAKELRQYFGKYEHLGTHVISERGTELIGKAPHIFDDNGIELDISSPTIPIIRKGGE